MWPLPLLQITFIRQDLLHAIARPVTSARQRVDVYCSVCNYKREVERFEFWLTCHVKSIAVVQNGGVSRNEYIERITAGSMAFGAKWILFGLHVSAGSDVTVNTDMAGLYSYCVLFFTRYGGNQIKGDETGGTCRMRRYMRNAYKIWSRNLIGRVHLGNPGVTGR